MAKYMKCYDDSDGSYLKKLKVSAERKDFFGGMKKYKNMTAFDNSYANDGKLSGTDKIDWGLFWLKCYWGKDKAKKKSVYLAEYKEHHKIWITQRVKQARLGHTPYMLTGAVGGHSENDPPKVYLYEGYEGDQKSCKLWVFKEKA